MSRRKLLIGVSIAGHAALFAGIATSQYWDLAQLDYEQRGKAVITYLPMPPPEGGSFSLPEVKMTRKEPKKVVVKETRQPVSRHEDLKITIEPGDENGGGTGTGTGTGTGPGIEGGEGTCKDELGRPCVAMTPPVLPELPKPPDPPKVVEDVSSDALRAMRLRGETAIHPPVDVRNEIYRSGQHSTSARLRVCLAENGTVSSVSVEQSTGYPAYDQELLTATRKWLYRPYTAGGKAVRACGLVVFQYTMK